MSADCLLGTVLADLLISVVINLSVSVWRISLCLSGLTLMNGLLGISSKLTPFVYLMGSGQCLSELVLTVFLLPMSVRGNLLMSAWTEPECFSCQYFLVISIGVLPEVFPNVFCRICLKGSLDVFLD